MIILGSFMRTGMVSSLVPILSARTRIALCDIPSLSWKLTAEPTRSEEHTSELQSLMRISYAVFCLKKKKTRQQTQNKQLRQRHNIHSQTTIKPKKYHYNN